MAVGIHLGIGVFMGMLTFGLIMIYGNLAFIEPQVWRRCCGSIGAGETTDMAEHRAVAAKTT
jgi:hypothetical protein